MRKSFSLVIAFAAVAFFAAPRPAAATDVRGVGLGVAGGVAYSGTKITVEGAKEAVGARPAWGFFVDIPLLPTFYISPAAMLYDVKYSVGDLGEKVTVKVTDIDLNFKFIVPVGDLHFGAGVTGGLTSGIGEDYSAHYGVLGFGSINLVANLDAFVLVQYKKLVNDDLPHFNDTHIFGGGMFRF